MWLFQTSFTRYIYFVFYMYCYMYLYINLIRINHVMIYIATPHKKKYTKQYTKIVHSQVLL